MTYKVGDKVVFYDKGFHKLKGTIVSHDEKSCKIETKSNVAYYVRAKDIVRKCVKFNSDIVAFYVGIYVLTIMAVAGIVLVIANILMLIIW